MSELFEPRGIAENCWCSYFRMTAKDYSSFRAATRKDMLRDLVETGEPVGVLGSVDDLPDGWIGVGPRSGFPRLHRSRVAKLFEGDYPTRTWSIVCVYLSPGHRLQGLVKVLVDRATEWARDEQAEFVEAYPEDDRDPEAVVDPSSFHGRVSTFEACGFTVVEPGLQRRALVRKTLRRPSTRSSISTITSGSRCVGKGVRPLGAWSSMRTSGDTSGALGQERQRSGHDSRA